MKWSPVNNKEVVSVDGASRLRDFTGADVGFQKVRSEWQLRKERCVASPFLSGFSYSSKLPDRLLSYRLIVNFLRYVSTIYCSSTQTFSHYDKHREWYLCNTLRITCSWRRQYLGFPAAPGDTQLPREQRIDVRSCKPLVAQGWESQHFIQSPWCSPTPLEAALNLLFRDDSFVIRLHIITHNFP